jgi:hypothetical protein
VVLAFVLLFQVAAASPRARPTNLTATAQASARPRECASGPMRGATRWAPNVWDVARDPTLDGYCDLLASGFAQLSFSPDRALEMADRAERASPGRAGPWVLRGRAQASKKAWEEARGAFERARAIDAQSLEDPLTMRDWARALARVRSAKDALAVYRTLGPRLSALAAPDERARTFVEAAEVGFALGPEGLDDAIAFLGEAKQLAGRELEWRVGAELALALDRKGAKDEVAGLVADLARRFRKDARPASAAENAEEQAATALVLEAIDARQAVDAWGKYLASVGERAPFAEHAQKHAAALRKRTGDVPREGR